jgi:hypothetical protein
MNALDGMFPGSGLTGLLFHERATDRLAKNPPWSESAPLASLPLL